MGHRFVLARGLQKLCGALCCATDFGHVWGINNSGVLDRQLDVLHSHRTDVAGGILVCALFPLSLVHLLKHRRRSPHEWDRLVLLNLATYNSSLTLLTYSPAQIISGFISFGSLHILSTKLEPWQWYLFAWILPDSRWFILEAYAHHRDANVYYCGGILVWYL